MTWEDDYPDPQSVTSCVASKASWQTSWRSTWERRAEGGLLLFIDLRARAAEHGDRAIEPFEAAVLFWETARLSGDA